MKLYSIHDVKADSYSQPFVSDNDVSAKRVFLSFCVSNQFYKDFTLCCVGDFFPSEDQFRDKFPLKQTDSDSLVPNFVYLPIMGCIPDLVPVSEDEIAKAISDYRKYQKGVYNA